MIRRDELLLNGWQILQSDDQFCFGTDAVLLYHILPRPCGRTVDLCSGNGAVALMALAGDKAMQVTAVELREEGCRLATESAALNGAAHRLRMIHGDICHIDTLLPPAVWDTVCVNPPYFKKGSGLLPSDPAIAVSRHETECTLEDVLSAADYLLRKGGTLCMVHRTERREEICKKIKKYDLHPTSITRVFSTPERESKLFLLQTRKGMANERCKYFDFTVGDSNGALSAAYKKIYEE